MRLLSTTNANCMYVLYTRTHIYIYNVYMTDTQLHKCKYSTGHKSLNDVLQPMTYPRSPTNKIQARRRRRRGLPICHTDGGDGVCGAVSIPPAHVFRCSTLSQPLSCTLLSTPLPLSSPAHIPVTSLRRPMLGDGRDGCKNTKKILLFVRVRDYETPGL